MAKAKGADDDSTNILTHGQGTTGDANLAPDQQGHQISKDARFLNMGTGQERSSHHWFQRRHESALRDRLKDMQVIARRQAYSKQQYQKNIREFVDLCIQCSEKND